MKTRKEAEALAKVLRRATKSASWGTGFSLSCAVQRGVGVPYRVRIVCRPYCALCVAGAAARLTLAIYGILRRLQEVGEIGAYIGELYCELGRPVIAFTVGKD